MPIPSSPHARKRLALLWTGVCAFVLFLLLIFRYTMRKEEVERQGDMNQRLRTFYETISSQTQSFFDGK